MADTASNLVRDGGRLQMIHPPTLGPVAGLYSHVSVGSGRVACIAGQFGLDQDGVLVGDDIESQVEGAFRNIGLAVEGAGGSWGSIAKMTTYLTSADWIEPFYATRERLYASLFPHGDYPPNTLIVVSRLVKPEFLVEIEAIAVLDGEGLPQ